MVTHRKPGEWPKGTDAFEYRYLDMDKREFVTLEELSNRYQSNYYLARVDASPHYDQVLTACCSREFQLHEAVAMCRELSGL